MCLEWNMFSMHNNRIITILVRREYRPAKEVTRELLSLFGSKCLISLQGAYHPDRSGDLLLVADSKSWFSYYYWQNDAQAPDFARCVEIHR